MVVGVYFKERFALAMSLASTGICVGYMVLPPVIIFLIASYGWRGALVIFSACLMNMFVSACLFRPLARSKHISRKLETTDEDKAHGDNGDVELNQIRQNDPESAPEHAEESERGTASRNCCKATSTSTGIPELCFTPHYPITLFTVLVIGCLCCINIYIAPKVVNLGYSKSQGALVLSVVGVGSLAGRLVHGILIDLKYASTQTVYLTSFASCGIGLLLTPLTSHLVLISILGFTFGMFVGILTPLSYVIAREVSSPHLLAQVLGYMVLTNGGGTMMGAVFGGRFLPFLYTY